MQTPLFFTCVQLKGSFAEEKNLLDWNKVRVLYVTRAASCRIRRRRHGGGFFSLSTTASRLWRPSGPPDDGPWLYFPFAHSRFAFVMPQITNGLKCLPPQPINKDLCLKEGWDGQSFCGDKNINSDSQWTIIISTIIIFTAAAAEMCSQSIELRESIAPWGALNRWRRHPNLPSSDGMSLENNWGLRSNHSKHVRMTSELAKVVVSILKGTMSAR